MNAATHKSFREQTPAIVVNNVSMLPIEVNGERVVTLAMIDRVHGRSDGTARRNFNANRSRLVAGEDFSKISADEFRTRFPGQLSGRVTEDVTVLTESGYLMLVKSFTDDLAWAVQRSLVRTYFAKPANNDPQPLHVAESREFRLAMNLNLKMAKMAGLVGNQALISANNATAKLTGVNALKLLGVSHMDAPQNEALLIPTEIGRRTGLGSGRVVNARLCLLGLQWQFRDAKGHVYYEPTDAGIKAGAVMQDTSKKNGDGTPIRQLKWASSIIEYLKGREGTA
jgi:hypothetical protein